MKPKQRQCVFCIKNIPGSYVNQQSPTEYSVFFLYRSRIVETFIVLVLWNLYIQCFRLFSHDVIAKRKEISCAYFCFCSNIVCFCLLHIFCYKQSYSVAIYMSNTQVYFITIVFSFLRDKVVLRNEHLPVKILFVQGFQ